MRFTLSFTSDCPLIKICSIVDISLQLFRRNALLAAIMYNLFYTLTWFALLVFSFFDFVPAIWIRRIHDTNTHHHAGNNNCIYTLWYTPRLRLLLKNSYSIYSTIGY